ncbi:MAG TPA: ArsR family transcriptional regulator [Candidatus Binatia bacterium]|nr:ArsR family transcriptional regulator [Candidatus Binatia bacterium]
MTAQKIQRLKRFITDPGLRNTHRMMRVVSGVSRFRILRLLKAYGGSLNVTEIAETLGVSCSLVSHEMRILRKSALVTPVTRGREVFYKTSPKLQRSFPAL